ncbi:MAG: hypothetical protein ACTS5I_17835, partial [Rhodanobacter sp.]
LDPANDDARSQRYRLLARVLRQPVAHALPADFAQKLATHVGAVRSPAATSSTSLELKLTLVLGAVLAIAAGAVITIYGSLWLPSFTQLLPQAPATHWLLALSGCLGASWLLEHWPRRT